MAVGIGGVAGQRTGFRRGGRVGRCTHWHDWLKNSLVGLPETFFPGVTSISTSGFPNGELAIDFEQDWGRLRKMEEKCVSRRRVRRDMGEGCNFVASAHVPLGGRLGVGGAA